MRKKVVRLTEEEFTLAIKHAINEIDGQTYASMHNSTVQAQQNQLNGIPNSSPRKTNMETIQHGISLGPRASDSLISKYKTDYLFHCKNLRGAAAITIFTLKELYCLDSNKAILKGDVVFNGEQLYGSIIVDMKTLDVVYN